jgi:hypothetical protein
MDYTILLHTHSSYSYLWPIINDYMKKYKFKKVLAYDRIPDNTILPDCFDKYIQYNGSEKFSGRLIPVLKELEEEFVFLIYDVDIVINIDEKALKNYIEIMNENNIDRVCCALFNGNGQIHKNEIALCNLNLPLKSRTNHFIPADCTSVIWKRISLIEMLKQFPNETYASLELNNDVINYCKTQIKCYGIQYTPNLQILYNRGLTYGDKLSFLHITTKGSLLTPLKCYHSYENILKDIITKYNLKLNMEVASNSCLNFIPLSI